ncbi:MAG: sensor histidine kinase [Flavobacteriales bacterium]|jgi:two-component system phosphate regulon sensor histidine kinase PhoR
MNNQKYQQILYFISTVIILTVCVQGYWSYKNYESEKKQFISEVQLSLDNAVDAYYTKLAKQNTLSYISDSIPSDSLFMEIQISDLVPSDSIIANRFKSLQSNDSFQTNKNSIIKSSNLDKLHFDFDTNDSHIKIKYFDSLNGNFPKHFEMLTSKIIVSFSEDSLSIGLIDSLIQQELKRKDISVIYGLSFTSKWNMNQQIREEIIITSDLVATSGSKFLLDENNLKMHYSNSTVAILKKNITSILLSLLLVSSIIICLIYLLKIIQKQKELAEIKNDLISNITHEFKTPLATINVALEGIERFNLNNDPEKSKKYADMSKKEVEKLTLMVEKLLETATLDSDQLELNTEEVDLNYILERITTIDIELLHGKTITFLSDEKDCLVSIDQFHFENALNNIIDNAIKYGGDFIKVFVNKTATEVNISIKDNGKSLTKQQASQIFEKFYRVPKGNTHNVKGFGIGLFYAKNIIEKHGGSISVDINNGVEFLIKLPTKSL